MICKHCGSENADTLEFCPFCGKPFDGQEEDTAPDEQEEILEEEPGEEPKPMSKEEKRRYRGMIAVIIIGGIAVLIIGLINLLDEMKRRDVSDAYKAALPAAIEQQKEKVTVAGIFEGSAEEFVQTYLDLSSLTVQAVSTVKLANGEIVKGTRLSLKATDGLKNAYLAADDTGKVRIAKDIHANLQKLLQAAEITRDNGYADAQQVIIDVTAGSGLLFSVNWL